MPDLEARTAQALRAIVWNHVAGKRLSLESASTVCICLLGDCGLQLRQAGYDIRG